jgi:hypothetical protein
MANFIKVGNHHINLDNITGCSDMKDTTYSNRAFYIFFGTDRNDFVGEEADALRWYFNTVSTDIGEIYQAKLASDKSNAEWNALLESHAAYLARPLGQILEAIRSLDDDQTDFKGEEGATLIETWITTYHPDWQTNKQ